MADNRGVAYMKPGVVEVQSIDFPKLWDPTTKKKIEHGVILMPMRKRQKKVADFQGALKVGDKVITTAGIYGQITKVNESSVQLQIAEKVRIEVAKASIGGFQGQEPVVPEAGSGL